MNAPLSNPISNVRDSALFQRRLASGGNDLTTLNAERIDVSGDGFLAA